MKSLAVLHASQLVTLAGPKRPRVGRELSELAIIPDGGMLIRDGKIESSGPAPRSRRTQATRKSSMLGKKLFFQDLSTRTRIWFLPEIGWTISSVVRAATLMSKSQRLGAEFGQRLKRREQRARPICSCRQKSMQTGSCAAERQRWSPNRATDLPSKTK